MLKHNAPPPLPLPILMITLPPATPFTLIAKLFLYVLNEFVFACLKFSTTYTRGPSQGERRAFLQGGWWKGEDQAITFLCS